MKNKKINYFNLSLVFLSLSWIISCSPDCGENTIACGDTDTCPGYLTCQEGTCVDPCEEVECPEQYTCIKGTCIYVGACQDINCPPGEVCYDGGCFAILQE